MNGLRYIREKAGLSGAALARKLTVAQPTVFEWEHGKRRIPPKQLAQLVKLFNIPEEYFKEISKSEQEEIDIIFEIARQRNRIEYEDNELEKANKELKTAIQNISKVTKQKANSFDTFSDYISSTLQYSKICNLFAEVLKLYKTDSTLQNCLTAIIQAKGAESESDNEITKAIRCELLRREDDKKIEQLSEEFDELY